MDTHQVIVNTILYRDVFMVSKSISEGDKETILLMIQQQLGRLGTREKHGNTLIHLLLDNKVLNPEDKIEILGILLDQGVDPNKKNEKGVTALHLAISKRNKEAINLLIERGAEIYVADNKGNTPAHYFIQSEYKTYMAHLKSRDLENIQKEGADFSEWLISKNFDFDRRNYERENALQRATILNLQHILPILLKNCTDIYCVREFDNLNLLQLFLEAYVSHQYSQTAANRIIHRRTLEIIKYLLDRGVSVDPVSTSMEALQLILQTDDNNDIENMILDRFSNVRQKNLSGQTWLHQVIARQSLLRVARKDPLKVIQSLIAKGSDVDNRDNLGMRPVHLVTCKTNYDKEVLDLLVTAGCNLNATNNAGETALHLAIIQGNSSIAQKLIERGANVNGRENSRGMTPLLLAAKKGFTQAIKLLLNNGANVNSRETRYGERPLHFIVDRNNGTANLSTLLRDGAYVNARDKYNESALCRAIKLRNYHTVEELLAYGADINDRRVIREIVKIEKLDWQRNAKLADIVSKHWIRLSVARLPCSEEYRIITHDQKFDQFERECMNEIIKLRNMTIDRQTSVYEWLHMDSYHRYNFINNDKLKTLVNTPALKRSFPKYAFLILAIYRETVTRKSMLEEGKLVLQKMTRINMPDVCLHIIFSFLTSMELLNLIDT